MGFKNWTKTAYFYLLLNSNFKIRNLVLRYTPLKLIMPSFSSLFRIFLFDFLPPLILKLDFTRKLSLGKNENWIYM